MADAIALLGVLGLVATGAASARPAQVSAFDLGLAPPGQATAECAPLAELHARTRGGAPARAAAPFAYDDDIGDVATAPDICAMNLVTNDNIFIRITLHVHDRSWFSPGDVYGIYFDTDSNAATGTDTDSGAPQGAEYAIEIVDARPWLLRWNGSSFDAVPPQAPIWTGWIDGFGPALQTARVDLGDPGAFKFALMTVHGDRDLAPDSGMWSYQPSPFVLTAGQLSVGSARAGMPLVARMKVRRSDFGIALRQGAITCMAKLGGRALAGRGSFFLERAGCMWRMPENARGKRVVGSVMVAFGGTTAKRSFSVTVR